MQSGSTLGGRWVSRFHVVYPDKGGSNFNVAPGFIEIMCDTVAWSHTEPQRQL